jgi:hypothetical protein
MGAGMVCDGGLRSVFRRLMGGYDVEEVVR